MAKCLLLVFAFLAISSVQLVRAAANEPGFYRIGPIVSDDESVQFELTQTNPAEKLAQLHVRIDNLNDYRVRVRVENAFSGPKRFIAPVELDLDRKNRPNVTSRLYDVQIESSVARSVVTVIRRSTNQGIFSLDLGTMIYEENFIQVQTTLPSSRVYGKMQFFMIHG